MRDHGDATPRLARFFYDRLELPVPCRNKKIALRIHLKKGYGRNAKGERER